MFLETRQGFTRQKVLVDSSPEPFVLRAGLLGWTKTAGWSIIENFQSTGTSCLSSFDPAWAQALNEEASVP